MNIRAKVREHISRRLLMKRDSDIFTDSESLFVSGRLDSLDVLATISFLESEYGIDLAKMEFDVILVDSVDAISGIAGDEACKVVTASLTRQ
jgi:acyl carrier protein